MEIMIDKNYRVEVISMNFLLKRRVPAGEFRGKWREESWVDDGYFSQLRHLYKAYLRKSLLDGEVKEFKEVLEEIERVEKNIEKMNTATYKEIEDMEKKIKELEKKIEKKGK